MLASEISRSLQLDDIIRAHGNECLSAFTKMLQDSPDSTIESFLNSGTPIDRSELAALVAIELRHRLSIGRSCHIEEYLERFPDLKEDSDQVLDLIYAEYCERRQHDATTKPQEFFERFPIFQKSLERLFQLDSLLQVNLLGGEAATLPDAGDTFLEFQLKRELGRGGCGRVFLAEQETLSNRRVVLKITPRQNIEHRTLARLNHPNIVPILSVHHDELSGLHAVCMPYRRAVALSDVRRMWSSGQPFPRQAAEYLKAVVASISADLPTTEECESSDFPVQKTFVVACAWIMYKIADALHHAHMRQICHRDLKPSNILLTAGGNPLLVDFNLSFNEVESGADFSAFFGGTLPYIPPEQILALHPIEQGRTEDVGPRADVYSLAATLFEVITGRLPFDLPQPGTDLLTALQSQLQRRYLGIPSARALNPNVPKDMDALLTKCLDPFPEKRYETAAQLAEDLNLFLLDHPLRHLPEKQLPLRIHKFVRRNHRRLVIGSAVVAIGLVASAYLHRERKARDRAEIQVSQLETTAEKEADAALSRLPNDPYKYFLLGREFFVARQYGHAMRCFSRSIELQPNYAPAYFYRGRCFANLDRDAEALEDYSKAIQYDPNDFYSVLTRAICYATSTTHSNPDNALMDLQRVRELLPDKEDESTRMIYLELARTYSALSAILSTHEARSTALHLAEQDLLKAFDLGLTTTYFNEVKKNDRFHRLDPLLELPSIQKLLRERSSDSYD